ncbi:MAG: YcaO-like family protein [Bdellovibrionales bacterium]|nr:YcaO-like family protein [Bdellovibrionales bacterium]
MEISSAACAVIPFERQVNLEIAKDSILTELESLSITREWEVFSEETGASSVKLTYGQISESGGGKGTFSEHVIGSYYEAFEHLVSNSQTEISSSSSIDLNSLSDCVILHPHIEQLRDKIRSPIWGGFFIGNKSKKKMFVPNILFDGHAADSFFSERCGFYQALIIENEIWSRNSNGTSSGANLEEALLHSMLEQIERISKGLFFFRCLSGVDHRAIEIPPKSLLFLQDYVDQIKKMKATNIRSFKLQNEFGIPTFVSICSIPGLAYPLVGSGSSLSPRHAVKRAIAELLQLVVFSQSTVHSEVYLADELRMSDLSIELPHFEDIRKFHLLFKDEEETFEDEPKISVSEQVKIIQTILLTEFDELFVRHLYRSSRTGVSVVQSYLPGTDNFFMVEDGWLVKPSAYLLSRV